MRRTHPLAVQVVCCNGGAVVYAEGRKDGGGVGLSLDANLGG